jgi:hypothetical protein
MLYVVGLGLWDKKDITVKGREALPFEAFDSAVGYGRTEHCADNQGCAREVSCMMSTK